MLRLAGFGRHASLHCVHGSSWFTLLRESSREDSLSRRFMASGHECGLRTYTPMRQWWRPKSHRFRAIFPQKMAPTSHTPPFSRSATYACLPCSLLPRHTDGHTNIHYLVPSGSTQHLCSGPVLVPSGGASVTPNARRVGGVRMTSRRLTVQEAAA